MLNRKHCVACLLANFDLFLKTHVGSYEISFRVLVIVFTFTRIIFLLQYPAYFPTLQHAPRIIRNMSKLESTMYHWITL